MLFIIGLLLGAVVVIFALQNITIITVAFLGWQFEGTLAWILILAALAGVLMSILISLPGIIKDSISLSHLRRHNKKLEEELLKHKELLAKTQENIVNPIFVEKTTIIETK